MKWLYLEVESKEKNYKNLILSTENVDLLVKTKLPQNCE